MRPTIAHFADCVGRAAREAVDAGRRRQVDDRAALVLLQYGHGAPAAHVGGVQIDGKRAPPILRLHVFHVRGRPGDAGIVNHDIEATQTGERRVEESVELGGIGDIGNHDAYRRVLRLEVLQAGFIDIADLDLGAGGQEGFGRDAADAGRRGSDDDVLVLQTRGHAFFVPTFCSRGNWRSRRASRTSGWRRSSAVWPEGSASGSTSQMSPPIRCMPCRPRMMTWASRMERPPGSGTPVPMQ